MGGNNDACFAKNGMVEYKIRFFASILVETKIVEQILPVTIVAA